MMQDPKYKSMSERMAETQQPPKVEAPSKGFSPAAWGEQQLDDMWEFAKGMFNIVPSLAKQIGHHIDNPEEYRKDLERAYSGKYFGEGVKELGKAVISYDEWKKHGLSRPLDRTFNTLTDAVGLISGSGAIIKNAGKVAKASGAIEKGERLIKAGLALEQLPGKLARGGVDKAVMGISGGKWDLAKRREFLQLKRESKAIASTAAEEDVENVLRKIHDLPDNERALFHQYRTQGVMPNELAKSPKLQEAYTAWKGLVEGEIQPYYKARRLLDDARIEGALAKKYALEKWGTVDDAAIANAKLEIKALRDAGGHGPVWAPNIFEGMKGKATRAEDVIDDLLTGGAKITAGKSGSLETLMGKAGYTKDPVKYIAHAIHGFRRDQAKLTLSERLLESQKLITGKGAPATVEEIVPEGVFRKYYADDIRAQALNKITDPTIKRLLRWEYVTTNHGALRLYDAFQRLFAKMATRWNPRWYYGQVIGNAILGELAGQRLLQGRGLLKKGAMPPEVMAKTGMAVGDDVAQGVKNGILERASDIASGIDQLARAGIVTREGMRKLMDAGYSFEQASEMLEPVLRSTREFSKLQVEMRLLREQVERRSVTVREYDAKIAPLKAKADRLENAIIAHRNKRYRQRTKETDPEKVDALKKQSPKEAAIEAKLDDLKQQIVNLDKERSDVVGDITSDMAKTGQLEARIPDLQKQVVIARDAVDRANAFIGDYLGLDGFEQGVMKRIIPFYPWTKAMTMLAFRLPFLAPVKGLLWHRFAELMTDLSNDPNMPNELRGYAPVAALEDGKTAWVKATSFSPFESLRTSKVGDIPVPAMFNIAERNPVLSLAFNLVGGRTVFNVGTIPYGTQAVMLNDGAVARITPDGMFKEEIPQTPLVSGVAHMFPTVQWIKNILTPYWTNKYDWKGMPQPILNPDGSYKYPRELQDRIGSLLGIPIISRSKEDWKRSEAIKVRRAMQQLRNSYRRGDPEEKAMILEAMKDYQSGELRKFKR